MNSSESNHVAKTAGAAFTNGPRDVLMNMQQSVISPLGVFLSKMFWGFIYFLCNFFSR